MRAARYDRLGPAAEVLEILDLEDPRPAPGEVRVRLAFSGVNPTDWKRRLLGPAQPPPGGQIPNQDGAGEIDDVGEGVPAARLGERVWVFHAAWNRPGGTAAQYVCVPAQQAVPLPSHTSLELGASLGIPYITAHAALTGDGPIQGSTVLVTGGAGAVGHAAVELGTFLGAKVIATTSTPEKAASARSAGAAAVLDYRSETYVDDLRRIAPGGVDRIVDVAIGANFAASLKVIAPHGVLVSYASEVQDPMLPVRALMTVNATIRFLLVYNFTPHRIDAAISDITWALEEGRIQPLPTTILPLEAVAAAHGMVERGIFGRVLLDVRE
jgi:NADPH2:quinone reductase